MDRPQAPIHIKECRTELEGPLDVLLPVPWKDITRDDGNIDLAPMGMAG